MAASRTQNPPPTGPSPLKGANVLILDESAPVAAALRAQLEDRGATYVEVATTADEALDVLGRAARPVLLTMMDTFSGNAACKDVLRVLREHRARVHVTLHGRQPPERLGPVRAFIGTAAYFHQVTAAAAASVAETVVARNLTVFRIIDERTVPDTLDDDAAVAIYGAPAGQSFPPTLRV